MKQASWELTTPKLKRNPQNIHMTFLKNTVKCIHHNDLDNKFNKIHDLVKNTIKQFKMTLFFK